jgi:hypothetical protein
MPSLRRCQRRRIQDKIWMTDVREMSYDIEDTLDDLYW